MSRIVHGEVQVLKCSSCGASIPNFEFAGDSDIETDGLVSAGICDGLTVVASEATSSEWQELGSGNSRGVLDRLKRQSKLANLQIPLMVRVEGGFTPPAGISFADFRNQYRPPIVVYACTCCAGGEATEFARHSVPDFIALGGDVVVIGDLVLQSR